MLLYLENLWILFVDMSFYIVIGLIFTGLLHAFVKKEIILKHIGKNTTGSVVKASILGVPLPLCSCGVVPTAMQLGKSGASKGAVVSFLTSTPQTGVDSIIATYGMMGGLFAFYRAIAAFFSGIISGIVTNIFCKNEKLSYTASSSTCGCSSENEKAAEQHCCCSSETEKATEQHCCCSSETEKATEQHCCCSSETEKTAEQHCCCSSQTEKASEQHSCCSQTQVQNENLSFFAKLKKAVKYAFGDFLDEISFHFVVGLLIAALISTLLPTSILSNFSNPIITMILMVIIGIPMYICSTASIPIAVSLMMKGISPGAAFVFLFAGPVTNIASLTILIKALGKKVTAIYLACAAVCSISFGLILDYIINITNYQGISNILSHSHAHETPLHMTIIAVLFGLLILKSLAKRFIKNRK